MPIRNRKINYQLKEYIVGKENWYKAWVKEWYNIWVYDTIQNKWFDFTRLIINMIAWAAAYWILDYFINIT